MPIDPSIPLKVNPIEVANPLQLAQQAQAISSARTAQRTAEEDLPRVQAESQLKQREAQASQWWTTNRDKYNVTDPKDPTKKTFDLDAAIEGMTQAGYAPEATMLMHQHLVTKAEKIKNADDYVGLLRKASTYAGQVLQALPPDQHSKVVQNAAKDLNALMPGSADMIFGAPDQQGNYAAPDQQGINSLIAAGQTPAETEALAQQQGTTKGPAGRDTNSAVTRDAYAKLKAAGVNASPGQTYDQLMSDATNAAILQGNIVPQEAKAAAVTNVNELFGKQQMANAGTKAANDLLKDLKYKLVPSDILSNIISKYTTDPRLQDLAAALDVYEKSTGVKLDRDKLSIQSASDLLKEWNRSKLTPDIKSQKQIQSSSRYSDIDTAEKSVPEQDRKEQKERTDRVKEAAKSGKVPMRVNGKVIDIDQKDVDKMKRVFKAEEVK